MQPQDELENFFHLYCLFIHMHTSHHDYFCLFTVCGLGNVAFFACPTHLILKLCL